MSYPSEAISLQQANAVVFELMELGLTEEFQNMSDMQKMRSVMEVLHAFGVSAATVVKTSEYSTGSTSVLRFVRMNIHTIHEDMDDLLADWYATYEVVGRDNIASFFLTQASQGCQ